MPVVERALRLDPCDGGRNLSGFSRTIGFEDCEDDEAGCWDEDACRIRARDWAWVFERCHRYIEEPTPDLMLRNGRRACPARADATCPTTYSIATNTDAARRLYRTKKTKGISTSFEQAKGTVWPFLETGTTLRHVRQTEQTQHSGHFWTKA